MNNEKIYYSISEAEQMTGLPASTLRYWEKQFDTLRPHKDGHGNRHYRKEEIDFIKQVRFLRDELHITRIEAIRNLLSQTGHTVDIRTRTTDILVRIREELLGIRSHLA